ncbi:DoxX family membrane protein [Dietzia cinnamea]|uniref:DoxX family membrane protein n=2 Tax=Dietzia TaxID=37914 RepID=A0AAW5QDR9_9ACTN|nr:DoxX family membrane protein [Dietzia cinnamea]MCT1864566.1 DoxX family membrane protein [Dietzia cinnamea]MCT2031629.1 DoxX family membrane protein [Dietzia cinnamea]MCT2033076.1 DoxX family membrane protein [Dietzia cinnamea]MCT2062905.1 DoxX family membrane protein [Dietzia cinnamea]MCT2077861.1 DoxX family membrane protein [Dietzia cinnamea]
MIRRLARPMLATVFVIDGVETLRNPQAHVADAAPLVNKAAPLVEKGEQAVNEKVTTSVPPVPKDTETLVKALAGVKIGAGALFALGKAPRLSALALTAAHAPSAISRHAFWMESDPAARSRKTTGLATDVALLGALLLASVDTAGQPGLAWRARKAGDTVAAKLPGAKAESAAAGAAIAGVAHSVADQARGAADTIRDKAPEVAETVREKAPEVAEQVREQATGVAGVVREKAPEVAGRLRGRADAARDQAAPIAAQVRDAAVPVAAEVRGRADAAARVASDQADDVRKAALARKKAAEKQAKKKSARLGKDAKKKTARFEKDAGKAALMAKKKTDEVRAKAADAIHP